MHYVSDLTKRLKPVFEKYQVQKAILFGSMARGEATRRSDIDLILIQNTEKRFLDRYDGLLGDLNDAVSGRVVEALIYTPEELQRISHRAFISRALEEGMVIYESKQESL
jgi:predicted nucleotidyltransferase